MVGAKVNEYLLEKSRVVYQNPGELNFHVFYCMMAGLSKEDKAACRFEGKDSQWVDGRGSEGRGGDRGGGRGREGTEGEGEGRGVRGWEGRGGMGRGVRGREGRGREGRGVRGREGGEGERKGGSITDNWHIPYRYMSNGWDVMKQIGPMKEIQMEELQNAMDLVGFEEEVGVSQMGGWAGLSVLAACLTCMLVPV